MSAQPVVSVVLMTYNHERFISEAIESVLRQEAPFEIELIITEDCSTDTTREVVLDFAARHPDVIRTSLSVRNQNDNEVFLRAYRQARGEFIAYLDGDDVWTRPDKLRQQVEFLRKHPDSSCSFHAVDVVDDDGRHLERLGSHARWMSPTLVLEGNSISSCSALFRRAALGELPVWFDEMPFIDWPLYLLASKAGPLGYLDETMAAYRRHGGGYWSALPDADRYRTQIDFYRIVEPVLDEAERKVARRYVAGAWADLASALAAQGSRRQAAKALLTSVRLAPVHPRTSWLGGRRPPRAPTVLRLVSPSLHAVLARSLRTVRDRPPQSS